MFPIITNFQFADRGYYGYNPLKIKDECKVWLDGKDTSQFLLNGNKVIQWNCKGSLAAHVSNAIDAQRPTYDPLTGRVTFVSANSTFLQSAAFGAALSQPNTVFVVYKITGALSDYEVVFCSSVGAWKTMMGYVTSNFFIQSSVALPTATINANDNIHVGLFNGASSKYWINGILGVSGNVGTVGLDGITLGKRPDDLNHADCEIMEVIGYNASISANDRERITRGLGYKWGIVI